MRPHNQRTRSPLYTFEGQASLLTGPAQVLRQTSLQVHQLAIREQSPGLIPDARSQLNASFHLHPSALPRREDSESSRIVTYFLSLLSSLCNKAEILHLIVR